MLKERKVPQYPSCLFFQYITQLGLLYHILFDSSVTNFSIRAKLDILQSVMNCLYCQVYPLYNSLCNGWNWENGAEISSGLKDHQGSKIWTITKYHAQEGIYADDCLAQRVTRHKCCSHKPGTLKEEP